MECWEGRRCIAEAKKNKTDASANRGKYVDDESLGLAMESGVSQSGDECEKPGREIRVTLRAADQVT